MRMNPVTGCGREDPDQVEEQVDEDQPPPEVRLGSGEEREDAQKAMLAAAPPASGAPCGQDVAERNADQQRHHGGHHYELQRDGQVLADFGADRQIGLP
jgi:hypothetical protein